MTKVWYIEFRKIKTKMSSAPEVKKFERHLPPPEGDVRNYTDAVKEEERALKIEASLQRGISWKNFIGRVLLGWGDTRRYNEAMRGVKAAENRSKAYSEEYLDLLIPDAQRTMEATSDHRFRDAPDSNK